MKIKISVFALLAIAITPRLDAQMNIGSTAVPDASAMSQVSGVSSTGAYKGFLLPVLTTSQRSGISNPAPGVMIFNSTTNQMEVNRYYHLAHLDRHHRKFHGDFHFAY